MSFLFCEMEEFATSLKSSYFIISNIMILSVSLVSTTNLPTGSSFKEILTFSASTTTLFSLLH